MISLLKFMRNISKYHFSGERVLLNSIMDIHYSTAEGGADQNRMAVHVRGGAVIWSFWFVHCMYQSYCRLIIYRFQIHLLLLVYKLYSFFCFGFSNIWKNTLTCIMWVIQEGCYLNLPNIIRRKKFMHEVFWYSEATFQDSKKHF